MIKAFLISGVQLELDFCIKAKMIPDGAYFFAFIEIIVKLSLTLVCDKERHNLDYLRQKLVVT